MVVLYTDPCFLEHETGEHPECPARLRAIHERLERTGLSERLPHGKVQAASREQIARNHSRDYIEAVERFAQQGGGRIEADTVVSPRSFDVAVQAAGTAVSAVDRVLSDDADRRAVCLVRPPGHHARPAHAMGFCLINNVAVAARHARAAYGLDRILIVDWDVHHGNGTQETFYEEGEVTFFSAHRYPFYPGTGAVQETGSGAGLGTTFNLPLRFGITRRDYREQFHTMLETAAERCRPELVLISAGFDAHRADPIGSLGLESEDFGDLTDLVVDVAEQYCQGRLVSLLEGGYDLPALAESVELHLERLAKTCQ